MKKYLGLITIAIILALIPGLNLVHATTLFSDNFDDGNSSGWTTQYGSWSVISDNGNYVLYQSSTSEGRAWAGSSSWTNYSVEAKVKVESFNGSNRALVCARMKDGNNYYAASLVGGGKLEIRKKVSGGTTILVTKDYSLSTSTWYKVRLTVKGSSIQMYVNDSLQLSATDSSLSSGGIGVIAYKTVTKYDAIVVSDSSSDTIPTASAEPTPSTKPTASTSPTNESASFALVGFASQNGGTTGGGGNNVVTVSTGSALQTAINKGNTTIYVNGVISQSNSSEDCIRVKNVSNVSIIGLGSGGELNGIGINVASAKNIVIRNLKIHHVTASVGSGDAIEVIDSINIWIDHNELYNDLNHDKDYYDGLCDIKKSSAYVTVSWNYFHDSYKTSLVGFSDSDNYDRKITYHHNYFKDCNSRLPSYRFGTGHVYNNYYENVASSGVNCRMGAKLRIENNYFANVANPICFLDSDATGYWDVRNNKFENCSGSQPATSTCSFTPPYNYTLNEVSDVKSLVTQYAGIGKLNTEPGLSPSKTASALPSVTRTPSATKTPSATTTKTPSPSVTKTPSASPSTGPTSGDLFVSTSGSANNSGTISSPLTLEAAITKIQAGRTIYMRGGTYSYSLPITIARENCGTSGSPKKIMAYGSELPVLDFSKQSFSSTNRGLSIYGHYWYVKGLKIQKAGDNGMFIGGNYNTVENCEFYANRDSGLQISRYLSSLSSIKDWPSYNKILNCYSHDNYDPDNGEDADGFACKLTVGYGNYFYGCISKYNCDDGWDLYTKDDTGKIGPVTIENCEASNNGKTSTGQGTSGSDGNGFKLGGSDIAVSHVVKNCKAYTNKKDGFTANSNPGPIYLSGCVASGNGGVSFKDVSNR